MLDRTVAPPFGKLKDSQMPVPALHHLDNGLAVHVIDAGRQEVMKVELVFPAGEASSTKKAVAAATSALMDEGTRLRSGAAIAEAVDYFGAHLQTEIDTDEAALSLYTLSFCLKETLPVLAEVYHAPSFPATELEIYARNQQQSAELNEQKVSHLASKEFKAQLYGAENPLGRSMAPNDYHDLQREDVTAHFTEKLEANIQHIIVAGSVADETLGMLNNLFGQQPLRQTVQHAHDILHHGVSRSHVDRHGAVQNAIRVGRKLFDRTHPDHTGMLFLCTVLGGYFGSRLMANIREDKGYTYGINASISSMRHTGHLVISTEVGTSVCEAAIGEIFKEMALLRSELMTTREVETVRNYLLGLLLKGMDGPFAQASKWRNYLKHGLGAEAHSDAIRQINAMAPERLLQLAQLYLQEEDMVVVTAGG